MDLSDAVRGRASIWSVDGLNSGEADDDELLEHVGLLEEIPTDSICEREIDFFVDFLVATAAVVVAAAFACLSPVFGLLWAHFAVYSFGDAMFLLCEWS